MNQWFAGIVALLALVLTPHAMLRAGEDEDRADKRQTPAEVEKDRQAFLQSLGEGPVYQIDILYRCADDGRLYLCQTLLSPKRPRSPGGIPGFGLDAQGTPREVPDPMRVPHLRGIEASKPSKGEKRLAPLAYRTRYLGAGLDTIHVTDIAVGGINLPKEPGQIKLILFHDAAFRFERLTPEQVKDYQPLREDPDYFHARVGALRKELLTTHRDLLTRHDKYIFQAAILLQEPFLLDLVRQRCRDWSELPAGEKEQVPTGALRALSLAGDASDGKRMQLWLKNRPDAGYWIGNAAIHLVRRHGLADFLPLITDLIRDPSIAEPEANAKRLLDFDKKLPRMSQGDQFLLRLAEHYRRSPADFGFQNVPERLLAERLTISPEDRERVQDAVKHPQPSDWIYLNSADRERGQAAAIAWLETIAAKR